MCGASRPLMYEGCFDAGNWMDKGRVLVSMYAGDW